ncbi:MAG: YicC family protein [Clostridia bacterium]|nr:YicC family protein [Clostridia bacterium]
MIKSMTGFGRGTSQAEGKEFTVEIKTVNHRYVDIFVKYPRQLSFLEDKVREVVGKSLSRGKIDVYISFEDKGEDSKTVLLDEALAKAYISAIQNLKEKFGLNDDASVSLVSRFPDVLRVEKVETDEEKLWNLLKAALEGALESLIAMRLKEGKELRSSLLDKADYIESVLKTISQRSPEVVKEYKAKLENRIKELLDQQTVDENRIAMEVAIFADRCSIDEEIVRLGSHIGQLRDTLNSQQPVGRKLDFLVQEMNREINTIGSKANDLVITKSVIDLKSEIEKIREQIQNIE